MKIWDSVYISCHKITDPSPYLCDVIYECSSRATILSHSLVTCFKQVFTYCDVTFFLLLVSQMHKTEIFLSLLKIEAQHKWRSTKSVKKGCFVSTSEKFIFISQTATSKPDYENMENDSMSISRIRMSVSTLVKLSRNRCVKAWKKNIKKPFEFRAPGKKIQTVKRPDFKWQLCNRPNAGPVYRYH